MNCKAWVCFFFFNWNQKCHKIHRLERATFNFPWNKTNGHSFTVQRAYKSNPLSFTCSMNVLPVGGCSSEFGVSNIYLWYRSIRFNKFSYKIVCWLMHNFTVHCCLHWILWKMWNRLFRSKSSKDGTSKKKKSSKIASSSNESQCSAKKTSQNSKSKGRNLVFFERK